jgi:hypothetical protein
MLLIITMVKYILAAIQKCGYFRRYTKVHASD